MYNVGLDCTANTQYFFFSLFRAFPLFLAIHFFGSLEMLKRFVRSKRRLLKSVSRFEFEFIRVSERFYTKRFCTEHLSPFLLLAYIVRHLARRTCSDCIATWSHSISCRWRVCECMCVHVRMYVYTYGNLCDLNWTKIKAETDMNIVCDYAVWSVLAKFPCICI